MPKPAYPPAKKSARITPHIYRPIQDYEVLDALFFRLRDAYFGEEARRTQPMVRGKTVGAVAANPFVVRESGVMAGARPFFYVKAPRDEGWLFERTDYGWAVSRAHKIVRDAKFVRSGEVWDKVMIFRSDDSPTGVLPRVWSERFSSSFPTPTTAGDGAGYSGFSLMPFNIYRQHLLGETIGDSET